MILSARQLAYLHQTPRTWPMTRGEMLAQQGKPLRMPDLGEFAPIMDSFVESGRFTVSFNGPAPLTWLDIWAYGQAACGPVPASINRIWLAMSRAYVTELALATEPMRVSPAEQESA